MRTFSKSGLLAVAALLPFAFTSVDLSAQVTEEQPEVGVCQATVQPAQVTSGSPAARVSITLSQPIGEVSDFQAGEDSGLQLASEEDVRRVAMTAGGQEVQPIEMANEQNRLTVWVNTADAQAGSHEFTLTGAEGECKGTITINPGG